VKQYSPANQALTLQVPYPRWLPDGGVAETREAPSNEGASFIGPNYPMAVVPGITVFKTVAFVHSAIPPLRTDAGVEAAGPQIYCTY